MNKAPARATFDLRCLLLSRPEPNAWTATVLVNELHASGFEGAPNHVNRGTPGRMGTGLEVPDRNDSHRGFVGEICLAPIKESPGGTTLFCADHRQLHCAGIDQSYQEYKKWLDLINYI